MPTATTELNERLDSAKSRLKELQTEREELANALEVRDDAAKTIDVKPEQLKRFREILDESKEARTVVEFIEGTLEGKAFLDRAEGAGVGPLATMAALVNESRPSYKSIGQQFVESERFKELDGGKNGLTMRTPWETKVSDLAGHFVGTSAMGAKDVYSSMPTGGAFGTVQRDALVERQRRRTRVRDLFPIQQTTAAVIEFFRQTGFTNNASPVAERDVAGTSFAIKPHSTITFKRESTTIRTIAHWEAAHRNVLADEPQLRGIIDTELLYGLQLVEDSQILTGTGTGEDLLGILNTPGTQQYAQLADGEAGDQKADALRRAMTLVTLAYYETTGVVVNDLDWEDLELLKDDNGNYILAVSIALGGEPRVWRAPVVQTPAIPEGTGLVGAFGLGAQLYDREEATIRVAEQHADFFIRNGVVILAEERIGLATKRPEAFVEVAFNPAGVNP